MPPLLFQALFASEDTSKRQSMRHIMSGGGLFLTICGLARILRRAVLKARISRPDSRADIHPCDDPAFIANFQMV